MKKYLGIDLGGTNIKGGVVEENGNILVRKSVKTESDKGYEAVIDNIAALCETLLSESGLKLGDIEGIGIALPGMIDSGAGEVVYSNNINWKDVKIVKLIKEKLDTEIRITNDANAAALGEAVFGAGKKYKDSVFITLGTGVGGGIIIDGKIFAGNKSAGAEIGHTVIKAHGAKCTCGLSGCFEAYSSATALIRETKAVMRNDKNSLLWKACGGDINRINGKHPFDLYGKDSAAKKVVDEYIDYLSIGLVNIANVFRPEVIMLGGGVCAQGDNLIKPLQKLVDERIYGGELGPKVPIVIASLGNDAGFMGAAALLK